MVQALIVTGLFLYATVYVMYCYVLYVGAVNLEELLA